MPPSVPPLTAGERQQVFGVLHQVNPELAERVNIVLEPDPVVREIRAMSESLVQEMRHLEQTMAAQLGEVTGQIRTNMWMVVVVVIVALGLNGAVIGVGLSVGLTGVGTVTTVPVSVPVPMPAEGQP